MSIILEKIVLRGHYDHDKTTVVVAESNGYDYYVSKKQMQRAEKDAGITAGDWLELCDESPYHLIVTDVCPSVSTARRNAVAKRWNGHQKEVWRTIRIRESVFQRLEQNKDAGETWNDLLVRLLG